MSVILSKLKEVEDAFKVYRKSVNYYCVEPSDYNYGVMDADFTVYHKVVRELHELQEKIHATKLKRTEA